MQNKENKAEDAGEDVNSRVYELGYLLASNIKEHYEMKEYLGIE